MGESFRVAWEKAQTIDGWLLEEDAELLFSYATGPWCEVGSWKGRSTVILASTGHPGWAVDWFRGSPEHGEVSTLAEYRENTDGLPVTTLVGRLEEMHHHVPSDLSLVFLDAEHTFLATLLAFNLYAVKLQTGGHLVLHDCLPLEDGRDPWPQVTRFGMKVETMNGWRKVDEGGLSKVFLRL